VPTWLTDVTIPATHVDDIIATIVSSRIQRLVSESLDERLDILEIAVTAGQKYILDLFGRRAILNGRHDGYDSGNPVDGSSKLQCCPFYNFVNHFENPSRAHRK
jgi:hypothetical protein